MFSIIHKRHVWWIAIVWVLAMLVCLLIVPMFQKWRSAQYRERSKANLKQLMVAIRSYHDRYDSFPPAFVIGPDGKRWHSWRALILPDLDPELAKEYRMDEPWDGPDNSRLATRTPAAFQSMGRTPEDARTSFFAIVGKRTLWPAHQSMSIAKVLDGISNTIALVESSEPEISWLEPRDFLPGEFVRSFREGDLAKTYGGSTVALADGTQRFLSKQIDGVILNGMLTPQYGGNTFTGDDWPKNLVEDLPQQSLREPVPASSLNATDVVPLFSTPMNADRNQIWSAAFQMAWDDLKSVAGGAVKTQEHSELVDALNVASFDRKNLSAKSVISGLTNGEADQDAALVARIRAKFPDAGYSLQKMPKRDGQRAMRLMAMIRKQMPFTAPFTRFQKPLIFTEEATSTPVLSFGQEQSDEASGATLSGNNVFMGQLEICDDRGDESCVIKMLTSGSDCDELIIAMTEPKESLEQTWFVVRERIQNPNSQHQRRYLDSSETMQIPILNFSVIHHFDELEGLTVDGLGAPAYIARASIDVRLRLDETGGDFMSAGEAGIIGEFGHESFNADRVRRFIFNRPFFIAMKEPGASEPWFVAWIANTSLMEPFD